LNKLESCKLQPFITNQFSRTVLFNKVIVSKAQTTAILAALQQLPEQAKGRSLTDTLEQLEKFIGKEDVASLTPGQYHGGMARSRLYEIAGAINRLRRDSSITQG
jgi:hypothetical protein